MAVAVVVLVAVTIITNLIVRQAQSCHLEPAVIAPVIAVLREEVGPQRDGSVEVTHFRGELCQLDAPAGEVYNLGFDLLREIGGVRCGV